VFSPVVATAPNVLLFGVAQLLHRALDEARPSIVIASGELLSLPAIRDVSAPSS
jgi:ABC-type sulfate transport system permease subunit